MPTMNIGVACFVNRGLSNGLLHCWQNSQLEGCLRFSIIVSWVCLDAYFCEARLQPHLTDRCRTFHRKLQRINIANGKLQPIRILLGNTQRNSVAGIDGWFDRHHLFYGGWQANVDVGLDGGARLLIALLFGMRFDVVLRGRINLIVFAKCR